MSAFKNKTRRFFPSLSTYSETRDRGPDRHMTSVLARTSLENPPPLPRPSYSNRRRSNTLDAFTSNGTIGHYVFIQEARKMTPKAGDQEPEAAGTTNIRDRVEPIPTSSYPQHPSPPLLPPTMPSTPSTPSTDKPLPRLPIESEERFQPQREAPATPGRKQAHPIMPGSVREQDGRNFSSKSEPGNLREFSVLQQVEKDDEVNPSISHRPASAKAVLERLPTKKASFTFDTAPPQKPKSAGQSSSHLQLPSGLLGSRSTNNLTRPLQTNKGFDIPDSGITAIPRATSATNLLLPRNLMSGVKTLLTGNKDKRKTVPVPSISAPMPLPLQQSPKARQFFTGGPREHGPRRSENEEDDEEDEEYSNDEDTPPVYGYHGLADPKDLPESPVKNPKSEPMSREASPNAELLGLAIHRVTDSRLPESSASVHARHPLAILEVASAYAPTSAVSHGWMPDIVPGARPTARHAGAAVPLDNPKYTGSLMSRMGGLSLLSNTMEFAEPPQWFLDGYEKDPNPPKSPPVSETVNVEGVSTPDQERHSSSDDDDSSFKTAPMMRSAGSHKTIDYRLSTVQEEQKRNSDSTKRSSMDAGLLVDDAQLKRVKSELSMAHTDDDMFAAWNNYDTPEGTSMDDPFPPTPTRLSMYITMPLDSTENERFPVYDSEGGYFVADQSDLNQTKM